MVIKPNRTLSTYNASEDRLSVREQYCNKQHLKYLHYYGVDDAQRHTHTHTHTNETT